jgi:hypothetical protein
MLQSIMYQRAELFEVHWQSGAHARSFGPSVERGAGKRINELEHTYSKIGASLRRICGSVRA